MAGTGTKRNLSKGVTLKAKVAVVIALLLAIYEAAAILFNVGPTITDIIEGWPELVELLIVGGLMVWLAFHFGWDQFVRWNTGRAWQKHKEEDVFGRYDEEGK